MGGRRIRKPYGRVLYLQQNWGYNWVMTEQFTITIPEPLYRRARALAKSRNRSLDVLIADALDRGLTTDEADIEEEQSSSPFASAGEEGKKLHEETVAYEAMHDQLLATHFGEHVAIFNGQLVDHDPDFLTLLGRIDARYPDDVVLIKQVTPLPERELRIYSPRLERI